jgi:hypothetical protein
MIAFVSPSQIFLDHQTPQQNFKLEFELRTTNDDQTILFYYVCTSVFFLGVKFCQNAKNKNFKGIFYHRFFENLKKIAKKK